MSQEYRDRLILGLREMAAFLESHPAVPVNAGIDNRLNAFVYTREELETAARSYPRWQKGYSDSHMWLRVTFAGALSLDLNINRSAVCRKVVIGSHEEPARVVEDVEWICDTPLLSGDR